jgi:transposase InsO family protein
MAAIQINDVFEIENSKYRILSIEPDTVIWFELAKKSAWPAVIEKSTLVNIIMSGDACRVEDPFVAPIHLTPSTEHIFRRDKAYETIRRIVKHPLFYDTQVRVELSKVEKAFHETTDKVINDRLKKYWTYGQSKNALYPRYANSGAPGKVRTFSDKKSGRPRNNGTGKSAISTDDVKRLYRRAIEKFYFTRKTSFSVAYRQFKLLFRTLYRDVVENETPTEPQMRHFYSSQYKAIDKAINRISENAYRKDVRALVSTSTVQAIGPGSRYEIDATTADIYLVSDDDSNRVIGRPTLYILIDVFTRMVAGFYIGFGMPSYQTVINALVNAAMTKEESLNEIGETDVDLWPVSGLPDVLLADKGSEFFGKQSNNLLDIFTVHVENAPAYRGDAKGIVERFFGSWQNGFKNICEGIVTPSRLKKAGERDYRVDANVPISEFRRFMISGILAHNHTEISRSYDRAKDIPDTLPMTPISLWNWGTQNRSGALKTVDKQQLIAGLLPKATATTSALGLCFHGVYYNIESLTEEGAFLRKNFGEREKKYTIAYDPLCLNKVYVFFNSQSHIVVGTIHPRSRQFVDMTYDEVRARKKTQKELGTAVKQASDTARAMVEASGFKMAAELKKRTKHRPSITAAAKIKGIAANKKQAQKEERLQNSESHTLEHYTAGTDEYEDNLTFTNPSLDAIIKQQRKDAK